MGGGPTYFLYNWGDHPLCTMALLKTGGLRWERFVNVPHGPVFLLPFGVEKDKGMHRDLQVEFEVVLGLGGYVYGGRWKHGKPSKPFNFELLTTFKFRSYLEDLPCESDMYRFSHAQSNNWMFFLWIFPFKVSPRFPTNNLMQHLVSSSGSRS